MKSRLLFLLFTLLLVANQASGYSIQEKISQISSLDPEQQQIAFQELLDDQNISVTEKFDALKFFAFNLVMGNQLSLAMEKANQAKDFAIKHGLPRAEATSNKLIGIVFYYQGEHKTALSFYEKALTYFEVNDAPIETANVLNNIGLVQKQLSRYSAAIDSYKRAVPLYLNHGSEYDAVDVRYNIAGLYLSLKRFDKAIEILNQSIAYYHEQKAYLDLARAQGDLGVAYKGAGNNVEALQNINKALDYFLQQEDSYNLAATLHNLSEVHLNMGLPLKAIAVAQRGLEYSQLSGHKNAHVGNLHALSKGHFLVEEYVKAELFIEEALELADSIDYHTSGSPLAIKALVSASRKNPSLAIKFLDEYIEHTRLRYTAELNEQLAEFEALQLNQKLELLEQKSALNNQIQAQQSMEFKFSIVAITLLGLLLLVTYKKIKDSQVKKELALQVRNRTQQLSEANKQLLELSLLDGLSGLHNRRSFERDISNLWSEYHAGNGKFLLMLVDVDHFKAINDQYGHLFGDEVIKSLASILKTNVRATDRVYRYGGEEFAILFTHHEQQAVKETFKRIQYQLEQLENIDDTSISVTISAGLTAIEEAPESINSLIAETDKRLYNAKGAGRNLLVCS
ncbi:GGDEF domain-containing protein [Thalassotalea sp. M1531]|uniref:diguanylate cyclase n=1 Tax=Thalassotalea algicola TaxID=2716224 RepID=A0A7Y0LCE3_9GAMM|nr:tetratricopeptide repeat-containing diguanylate cyclase [Thalassotalea algicola]NMP31598.1 GGDEF domain-containing protein [Thalassotalea algicola]